MSRVRGKTSVFARNALISKTLTCAVNELGTGGIDPPGGRRSRITAVMTDAEIALMMRAVALQLPVSDCGRIPPAVP